MQRFAHVEKSLTLRTHCLDHAACFTLPGVMLTKPTEADEEVPRCRPSRVRPNYYRSVAPLPVGNLIRLDFQSRPKQNTTRGPAHPNPNTHTIA